jgi:hypothetical protein
LCNYLDNKTIRCIINIDLKKILGFHLLSRCNDDIFIKRNYENDKNNIIDNINKSIPNQLLCVFPEGTTMYKKSLEKSHKYATKNNLPLLNYVLLPKSGAFDLIKSSNKFEMVYDLTIKYDNESYPYNKIEDLSLFNIFFKFQFPKVIQFYIRKYDNINGIDLTNVFIEKDKIIQKNFDDIFEKMIIKPNLAYAVFNIYCILFFMFCWYNFSLFRYWFLFYIIFSYSYEVILPYFYENNYLFTFFKLNPFTPDFLNSH